MSDNKGDSIEKPRLILLLLCLSLSAAAAALPVTDGLIVHLRADSLDLDDGESITVWQDLAAADTVDGTVYAASGANLPTFRKRAYNGFPAVHFSNASALMSDEWTWDQTQGVCVFIVCTGGLPSGNRVAHIGDADGANFKTFACDISSDTTGADSSGSGVRYNNGWCLTSYAGANPVVEGAWQVSVRQIAQGGTYGSLIYAVDDAATLSVASNYPSRNINFNASGNVISVGNGRTGGDWTGGNWYFGDVAEVVVYNKQLNQTQRQHVMDYLNNQYKRSAHNPSPAYCSGEQGTPAGNQKAVTFSWNTGLNADLTAVNPTITQHFFYLSDSPDFSGVSPIWVSGGSATASYGPVLLDRDKTYYWRVDEGVYSLPGDPATIAGPVWLFATGPYFPDANPVLMAAADPDVLLEGDTVYIYPTSGGSRQFYTYSSTDLVNFQMHGPILDYDDIPWIESSGRYAWAPTIIKRDGLYYFYYSVGPKPSHIGVGVGTSPTGPFTDSGGPLLSDNGLSGFEAIDPMVFHDPVSGKYYLYAGGSAGARLRVFELNSDMVSFAQEITVNNPTNFTEGAFMHYRDGIYYMSYSHGGWRVDGDYSVYYSTASSPTGPWTYRGALLLGNSLYKSPGHHSFLYNGATDAWLMVYHRWDPIDMSKRSVAIDTLYYEPDGRLKPIVMTDRGVGPVPLSRWLASDFNEDGAVNLQDLTYFVQQGWLTDDDRADMAPLGGDGFVDLQDYEVFAQQWLR